MLKWPDKLDIDKGKVNLIYIQGTAIEIALAMSTSKYFKIHWTHQCNYFHSLSHNHILQQNRVFVKSIV